MCRRLPAIKYGGPLWCLAFLIPWWPWSSEPGSVLVGVHFCVSICIFDSFLTYVRSVYSTPFFFFVFPFLFLSSAPLAHILHYN